MLPPVFFERALPDDVGCAARQVKGRNFDGRIVRGVSRRCRHGYPQVVVCGPFRKGLPFPTTFWMTCPYLSRQIDLLESSGGVREMGEQLADTRNEEWILFGREHVLLRVFLLGFSMAESLRKEKPAVWESLTGTGVGGIRMNGDISVKCLHLQTASMIGMGWHPAGEWLVERLGSLECGDPKEWPCAKENNLEQ